MRGHIIERHEEFPERSYYKTIWIFAPSNHRVPGAFAYTILLQIILFDQCFQMVLNSTTISISERDYFFDRDTTTGFYQFKNLQG